MFLKVSVYGKRNIDDITSNQIMSSNCTRGNIIYEIIFSYKWQHKNYNLTSPDSSMTPKSNRIDFTKNRSQNERSINSEQESTRYHLLIMVTFGFVLFIMTVVIPANVLYLRWTIKRYQTFFFIFLLNDCIFVIEKMFVN